MAAMETSFTSGSNSLEEEIGYRLRAACAGFPAKLLAGLHVSRMVYLHAESLSIGPTARDVSLLPFSGVTNSLLACQVWQCLRDADYGLRHPAIRLLSVYPFHADPVLACSPLAAQHRAPRFFFMEDRQGRLFGGVAIENPSQWVAMSLLTFLAVSRWTFTCMAIRQQFEDSWREYLYPNALN